MNFLKWYYSLNPLHKTIGLFDNYKHGRVAHLEFVGECTIIWVTYKNKTIIYRAV